jgi:hypothetical protein
VPGSTGCVTSPSIQGTLLLDGTRNRRTPLRRQALIIIVVFVQAGCLERLVEQWVGE